ncbi:MAG: hypothetical protein KY476_00070 [Planctomycetes bacterium]|nr:hypothetical protein [Planctomycetota bacterium]
MTTTPTGTVIALLDDCCRRALRLLSQTWSHACTAGKDPWQFAVLQSTLEAVGLTQAVLNRLENDGLIELATEYTRHGDPERRFRHCDNARRSRRLAAVLTAMGAELIPQLLEPETPTRVVPEWDSERRELRLGSAVVKQFLRPAPNQTLILDAFEEEGWPRRIDDPLPPREGVDPRTRLHDAIKHLNRRLTQPLLHFLGDGTSCGVVWHQRP